MMKEPTDHLTEEQLLAYRDGELLVYEIEMHVMSCNECRKKLDQLNRLQALVGEALTGQAGAKKKYFQKQRLSKKDHLPDHQLSEDDIEHRVMFSRRRNHDHEKFKEDPVLRRAKELIKKPQKKQSIGELFSIDLEKRPAAVVQGDSRVRITGHEKPGYSEVCITIQDRNTDKPIAGIDITLLPETSGFENKPTDASGKVCFPVPPGRNRLIIHTKIPLETILINISK